MSAGARAPGSGELEALPAELARSLAEPDAHPHDPSARRGVEWVQTHISHVFLTRQRVYKLRKAVALPFLSFARREERNQDCLREVALNRRLAPDVYLGIAPILPGSPGSPPWGVGPVGESLADPDEDGLVREHCVVMRRLPPGADALSRLERGELAPRHLEAVADVLAAFHARTGLGRPAPFTPEAWLERTWKPVGDNIRLLLEEDTPEVPREGVERLGRLAEARFALAEARLEDRRLEGRAVDGHGDVHLQHVWFEPGREDAPLLIDCIEFNADLRSLDTASEVAFLAMDLAYRSREDLAAAFLARYAQQTDDFDLFGLVDFYASYRAAVRAKVAALASRDRSIGEAQRHAAAGSAARHLRLAEALLEDRPPGVLVVLCGTVGTGKSTVGRTLARAVRGVVVSSDRTRKRLAGLAPTDRASAPVGRGIYRAELTEAVYAGLLERAAPVISSGRVAVLDATFAQRRHRERARHWAEAQGAEVWLLEVSCPEPVARERLRERAAAGTDPSDAGPELLAASRERFEPTDEWPTDLRFRLDTSGDWAPELAGFAQALEASAAARGGPP